MQAFGSAGIPGYQAGLPLCFNMSEVILES